FVQGSRQQADWHRGVIPASILRRYAFPRLSEQFGDLIPAFLHGYFLLGQTEERRTLSTSSATRRSRVARDSFRPSSNYFAGTEVNNYHSLGSFDTAGNLHPTCSRRNHCAGIIGRIVSDGFDSQNDLIIRENCGKLRFPGNSTTGSMST